MTSYALKLRPGGIIPPAINIGIRMRKTPPTPVAPAAPVAQASGEATGFLDTFQDDPDVNAFVHVPDRGGMWFFPYADFDDQTRFYTFPNHDYFGPSSVSIDDDGGLKLGPDDGARSDYRHILMPGTQPRTKNYFLESDWEVDSAFPDEYAYVFMVGRAFPHADFDFGWDLEVDYEAGAELDMYAVDLSLSPSVNNCLDGGTGSSSATAPANGAGGKKLWTARMEYVDDRWQYLIDGAVIASGTLTDARSQNPGQIFLAMNWGYGGSPLGTSHIKLKRFKWDYVDALT